MELHFPEHGSDCFSINCEENSNEGYDVAVDLVSGDFHIVDVVINDAYEDRPDWADSMYDVKREVELSPCKDGSVEGEN